MDRGAKMLVIGLDHAACNPELGPGKARFTNDPSSVNCLACKDTEVWQKANKQMTVSEDEDFTITGNTEKLTFAKNK